MQRRLRFHWLIPAVFVIAACTGARDTEFDDLATGTAPTEPGEENAAGPGGAEDNRPGAPGGTNAGACKHRDGVDHDGDGLSFAQGDCNDCSADVHPSRLDIPGNGIDDDCSGAADDDGACDTGLSVSSTDAREAAKALGACKSADGKKGAWGVVSARYVLPDGTELPDPTSFGLLDNFGTTKPRHGQSLFALSSGTARAPGQPGYKSPSDASKGYTHGLPEGFPKKSPGCAGTEPGQGYDGAALELVLRVPSNAKSMSFEHDFFTYGYSQDVCSKYSDFFVALMSPAPAGVADGNIVFDAQGGPISVNSPLLQMCQPGTHGGIKFACAKGTSGLSGTGFEGKAATGWLRTTVPVQGGSEIKLTFAIWDSGDGTFDSTVLLDALRFWAQPVTKVQTVPAL